MRAFDIGWFSAVILVPFACQIPAAFGEPLTFHFSGEVRFINQSIDLGASVYVGAPFSGGYTFDPTGATDSYPDDPRTGNYYFGPPAHLWAQIGNYEFVTPNLIMFIGDDWLSGDIYEPISVTPFTAAGLQWTIMNILLGDESRTALDSDALPLDVPDLADFPDASSLRLYLPGDVVGIRCQITSLTPEPGSLSLLALCSALVIRRRHR